MCLFEIAIFEVDAEAIKASTRQERKPNIVRAYTTRGITINWITLISYLFEIFHSRKLKSIAKQECLSAPHYLKPVEAHSQITAF